ncbi:protein kinase domain containing protein [Nitzschia inconspicua]|uniref:Protein kinase domain containing protein n=1 Tax=Nitzschia inconspicua TaxID=303405 RepID=A0A9K3L3L4_9STRA|nr:protein kinase domain containing protein [Nitzschia inconspicua]
MTPQPSRRDREWRDSFADGGHSQSSSAQDEVERAACQAAIEVIEEFDDYSAIRNDARASMVAVFDPSEVYLDYSSASSSSGLKGIQQGVFSVYRLKSISLGDIHGRDPPFTDEMEENRKRFADRSNEGYFSVKFAHRDALQKSPKDALNAACAMALEAITLMNLPKHPHICQIYGVHVGGPNVGFAKPVLEENYFTIVDEISETLKQRISSWRKRESYEEERFDDLKQRQSEITQRLEVVVDIVSALEFLGNQKLVYLFHPGKCGFDSRMRRIKLHDFGHSQESGKVPYFHFTEERDMAKRVYCAPEVLKGREVTVAADVFAVGMLLWEVLMLKPPFHGMKRDQHMREVVTGEKRPHLSSQFPSTLREVMEGCWAAGTRLEMADVHNMLEELLLEGADLTWSSDGMTKSKSTRLVSHEDNDIHQMRSSKETHSKVRVGSQTQRSGEENSNETVSSSESPEVLSRGSEKIRYKPKCEKSVDGTENGAKSARSHISKNIKNSRQSRRSVSTGSNEMSSPSMRSGNSKDETESKSSKAVKPTKVKQSKSMDDSIKMSLGVQSTEGQRSKSMDRSHRALTSRKVKYEKHSDLTKVDNRDSKSLASRKSVGRSKSMDDSIKMSLGVQSTEGQRSKSMDHSHRAFTSRKVKYEKHSDLTKVDSRDSKSLASRKSVGSGKMMETRPSRKPRSSRKLTLSPQAGEVEPNNFLESMKNQVASIQRNLAPEKEVQEVVNPVSGRVCRGRGVRRSVSAKRHSSRTLTSRSSSREIVTPISQSPAVRHGVRSGLAQDRKSISCRNLAPPAEDGPKSTLIGLANECSTRSNNSTAVVTKKSSNGLTDTMVLGDPSRHAPARSRSSTFSASHSNHCAAKGPASFRRMSSDDAAIIQTLATAREELTRGGFSAGSSKSPLASPLSHGELSEKLTLKKSGGLLLANPKDEYGRTKKRAHPKSKTPVNQQQSKVFPSTSPTTMNLSKIDPLKSKRPNIDRMMMTEGAVELQGQ